MTHLAPRLFELSPADRFGKKIATFDAAKFPQPRKTLFGTFVDDLNNETNSTLPTDDDGDLPNFQEAMDNALGVLTRSPPLPWQAPMAALHRCARVAARLSSAASPPHVVDFVARWAAAWPSLDLNCMTHDWAPAVWCDVLSSYFLGLVDFNPDDAMIVHVPAIVYAGAKTNSTVLKQLQKSDTKLIHDVLVSIYKEYVCLNTFTAADGRATQRPLRPPGVVARFVRTVAALAHVLMSDVPTETDEDMPYKDALDYHVAELKQRYICDNLMSLVEEQNSHSHGDDGNDVLACELVGMLIPFLRTHKNVFAAVSKSSLQYTRVTNIGSYSTIPVGSYFIADCVKMFRGTYTRLSPHTLHVFAHILHQVLALFTPYTSYWDEFTREYGRLMRPLARSSDPVVRDALYHLLWGIIDERDHVEQPKSRYVFSHVPQTDQSAEAWCTGGADIFNLLSKSPHNVDVELLTTWLHVLECVSASVSPCGDSSASSQFIPTVMLRVAPAKAHVSSDVWRQFFSSVCRIVVGRMRGTHLTSSWRPRIIRDITFLTWIVDEAMSFIGVSKVSKNITEQETFDRTVLIIEMLTLLAHPMSTRFCVAPSHKSHVLDSILAPAITTIVRSHVVAAFRGAESPCSPDYPGRLSRWCGLTALCLRMLLSVLCNRSGHDGDISDKDKEALKALFEDLFEMWNALVATYIMTATDPSSEYILQIHDGVLDDFLGFAQLVTTLSPQVVSRMPSFHTTLLSLAPHVSPTWKRNNNPTNNYLSAIRRLLGERSRNEYVAGIRLQTILVREDFAKRRCTEIFDAIATAVATKVDDFSSHRCYLATKAMKALFLAAEGSAGPNLQDSHRTFLRELITKVTSADDWYTRTLLDHMLCIGVLCGDRDVFVRVVQKAGATDATLLTSQDCISIVFGDKLDDVFFVTYFMETFGKTKNSKGTVRFTMLQTGLEAALKAGRKNIANTILMTPSLRSQLPPAALVAALRHSMCNNGLIPRKHVQVLADSYIRDIPADVNSTKFLLRAYDTQAVFNQLLLPPPSPSTVSQTNLHCDIILDLIRQSADRLVLRLTAGDRAILSASSTKPQQTLSLKAVHNRIDTNKAIRGTTLAAIVHALYCGLGPWVITGSGKALSDTTPAVAYAAWYLLCCLGRSGTNIGHLSPEVHGMIITFIL